jgi:membrane fusion protein, copper/silver efflux system
MACVAGGFVAGSLRHPDRATAGPGGDGRKVLYYVDPMNPTHTSDQPGLAPCGMKLEPVYADEPLGTPAADGDAALAVGAVRISTERQQLAGIQIAEVKAGRLSHTVRLPGRVVADETRVYRVKAGLGGYLTSVAAHSNGSPVRKDEVLAELNSPDLLPAVQSLLFALGSRAQRVGGAEAGTAADDSVFDFDLSYQQSLETLRHMGMGQRQLDELVRTQKPARRIAITSPANGVLTARRASDELHVAMGEELFRVADLSRIWILTGVTGCESDYLKPGNEARVSVPRQARTIMATVSDALPMFDNDSRTLKVRLEADNPDYALRPDMFVDVELSVTLPEAIFISAESVLDTGQQRTVFLDRGDGHFEPRAVRTGRYLGGSVEILHGLAAGERIVTAGNFLLDSESRMKQAAAVHAQPPSTPDPVCNMSLAAGQSDHRP